MKLNLPLIVFDLECTSNQLIAEVRPEIQLNNYIIDIGATVVRQTKDGTLVRGESFSSLVRPEEQITPFIESLTHISNDMVKKERMWPEVSKSFEKWVVDVCGDLKKARLACWGGYFDVPMLRKMYVQYGLKYPFSGTCLDVKTIAAVHHTLSGKGIKELSVQSCSKHFKIEPDGQYHRALTDAKATADIAIKCFEDLSGGYFLNQNNGVYRHIKIK